MRIRELRIQQRIAAGLQPCGEMHERDLARIPHAGELAFGEKGGCEAEPVKTADELVFEPDLDAVGEPARVQCHEHIDDGGVDPGVAAIGSLLRAAADDVAKGGIDRDRITVRFDGRGEPARNMELVERQDAALVRPDPEDVLGVAALGHGEDAEAIGQQ